MSTDNLTLSPATELSSPPQEPVSARAEAAPAKKDWNITQLILFRISFVFFLIMSIPSTTVWYTKLFSVNWFNLHYRDLHDIASIQPNFVNFRGSSSLWALNGYGNWAISLAVATIVAANWTLLAKRPKNYDILYYWLRVIVRYRAGIGIIGFGFTKLFPVQMPYPSISLLNNDFGDLTGHKIFWSFIGIAPWYQIFTGIVEVAGGAMLFFRKTTFLGAAILFGALLDIVIVNFAYEGGVHVYSSYFVLFSGFLLLYYVPRIYKLLVLENYTVPVNYYPVLTENWQKYGRIILKTTAIFIFLPLFFYLQYLDFRYDPYKQPAVAGVKKLRGYYDVAEFRINNKLIPYSPVDSVRWNEVTFERWSTLTYKQKRPVPLDLSNGGGDPMRDIDRNFELTGVAGGRRVFYYQVDTTTQTLYLQDKFLPTRKKNSDIEDSKKSKATGAELYPENWISKEAQKNFGDENLKIAKIAQSNRRTREYNVTHPEDALRKKMILKYETTDGKKVILKGINENRDSLYIVLNRVEKEYAIPTSTLDAGKY
ncbi:MAG: hypothetical protein V4594_10325 [Bacteroidota bacterium]